MLLLSAPVLAFFIFNVPILALPSLSSVESPSDTSSPLLALSERSNIPLIPHQRQKREPLHGIFVRKGYKCGKEHYLMRSIERITNDVCQRKTVGNLKPNLQLQTDNSLEQFLEDKDVRKVSIRQNLRMSGLLFKEKGNNFDDHIVIHKVANGCRMVGLVRQFNTDKVGVYQNVMCTKV